MTSNIDKFTLQYYENRSSDLAKQLLELQEMSGNRYGIITGSLHAILGYHKHYAGDGDEALETIKKACAWLEWSDAIPKENWLKYTEVRELPFKFLDLWKKYKASGTTETFMSWWMAI